MPPPNHAFNRTRRYGRRSSRSIVAGGPINLILSERARQPFATRGVAMQDLPALLGILAAITVGAVSPGPSFVMVARTAVSSSRTNGIGAAIGMGIGGLLFAVAALLGVHGLLLAVPSLYV